MATIRIYATKEQSGFYYYRNGTKTRTGGYAYGFGGRTGTGESDNQYYFYSRFDLSALAGKYVTSAQVSVVRDGSESNNGGMAINAGIAPTDDFTTPDNKGVSQCSTADTRQMPTGAGDTRVYWNVSAAVTGMLATGSVDAYGVLWSTAKGSYTAFMSAHQSSEANRPYLEVVYVDGTVGYMHADGLHRCQVYYQHTDGLHRVEPYYMAAEGLRRISIG
jgi:hypothetical protein